MRKKLLFIHREKNIKKGVYLDDLFNQGEVNINDFNFFDEDDNYIDDEEEFYARNAGHIFHDTINFGVEAFYIMIEEKNIDSIPEGTHRFKSNGVIYEIFMDNEGYIKSMVRINK